MKVCVANKTFYFPVLPMIVFSGFPLDGAQIFIHYFYYIILVLNVICLFSETSTNLNQKASSLEAFQQASRMVPFCKSCSGSFCETVHNSFL